MFNLSETELKEKGAVITVQEIKQQPDLWLEAYQNYLGNKEKIAAFLEELARVSKKFRVILTGAGTSAYVGDTVVPFLRDAGSASFTFESIPTTDLVSNPYDFYQKDVPTLLVSFARSGNSPESIAAVSLGKKLVDTFYQITITCAADGALAKSAAHDEKNLLLLMPAKSNDKGFAMTGSYTCMTLTALLVFDQKDEQAKGNYVTSVVKMGRHVIEKEEVIDKLFNKEFERIVYLGSGALTGVAREAQLKILELTAGKIATMFDSSMGFRHGPKSFINARTLVIDFVSNHSYTKKYDEDILQEITADGIAAEVIALTTTANKVDYEQVSFAEEGRELPDAYLALPYVMVAQTAAVITAFRVGNKPDTPSPTGTVNRVVQGVIIHDL